MLFPQDDSELFETPPEQDEDGPSPQQDSGSGTGFFSSLSSVASGLTSPPPTSQPAPTDAQSLTPVPQAPDLSEIIKNFSTPKLEDYGYKPVWDELAPHQIYVGNQIAKGVQASATSQNYQSRFLNGETAQDIDAADQDAAQKRALLTSIAQKTEAEKELAGQTIHLDDHQFQAYLQHLQDTYAHQVTPPQMPALQAPNTAQLAATALTSFLDRHHGVADAAIPWQMGLQKQAQGYQQDQVRYQGEMAQQAQREKLAYELLGLQSKRDAIEQDAAQHAQDNTLKVLNTQIDQLHEDLNTLNKKQAGDLGERDKLQLQSLDTQIENAQQSFFNAKSSDARDKARTIWMQLAKQREDLLGKTGVGTTLPDAPGAYADESLKVANAGLATAKTATENLLRQPRFDTMNVNIDKARAQIQNIGSMIQNRQYQTDIAYRRLAQNGWAKSQSSINAGLRSIQAQADTIRNNIRGLQGQLATAMDSDKAAIQAQIDSGNATIGALSNEYGKLQTEARSVRDNITGSSQVPDTSTLGPTYGNKRQDGPGYPDGGPGAPAVTPTGPAGGPKLDVLSAAAKAKAGGDCSSFAQCTLQNLGIKNVPRTAIQQYKAGVPVDAKSIQPGDLIFFDNNQRDNYNTNGKSIGNGRFVNHVGVYMGNGMFIADKGKGDPETRTPLDVGQYLKETGYKFLGVRRFSGSANDGRIVDPLGKGYLVPKGK